MKSLSTFDRGFRKDYFCNGAPCRSLRRLGSSENKNFNTEEFVKNLAQNGTRGSPHATRSPVDTCVARQAGCQVRIRQSGKATTFRSDYSSCVPQGEDFPDSSHGQNPYFRHSPHVVCLIEFALPDTPKRFLVHIIYPFLPNSSERLDLDRPEFANVSGTPKRSLVLLEPNLRTRRNSSPRSSPELREFGFEMRLSPRTNTKIRTERDGTNTREK